VTISWVGTCKLTTYGVNIAAVENGKLRIQDLQHGVFASVLDPHSYLPVVHVALPQVGDPCVQVMMEFSGHSKTANSSTLTAGVTFSLTQTPF